MSLRKPRGEDFEIPTKPGTVKADVTKGHQLIQVGQRGFRCVCGKIFEGAVNRFDAQVRLRMHHSAILEMLEDRQKGVSYLDE